MFRPAGGLLHPVHGPRLAATLARFTAAINSVILGKLFSNSFAKF